MIDICEMQRFANQEICRSLAPDSLCEKFLILRPMMANQLFFYLFALHQSNANQPKVKKRLNTLFTLAKQSSPPQSEDNITQAG